MPDMNEPMRWLAVVTTAPRERRVDLADPYASDEDALEMRLAPTPRTPINVLVTV